MRPSQRAIGGVHCKGTTATMIVAITAGGAEEGGGVDPDIGTIQVEGKELFIIVLTFPP